MALWVDKKYSRTPFSRTLGEPSHSHLVSKLMVSSESLVREFGFSADVWRKWLAVDPHEDSTVSGSLDPKLSATALGLVDHLLVSGNYGRIGRRELVEHTRLSLCRPRNHRSGPLPV